MMTKEMKGMMLVLLIIYVISPVDLCPGPVDDLIAILIEVVAQRMIGRRNKSEVIDKVV